MSLTHWLTQHSISRPIRIAPFRRPLIGQWKQLATVTWLFKFIFHRNLYDDWTGLSNKKCQTPVWVLPLFSILSSQLKFQHERFGFLKTRWGHNFLWTNTIRDSLQTKVNFYFFTRNKRKTFYSVFSTENKKAGRYLKVYFYWLIQTDQKYIYVGVG